MMFSEDHGVAKDMSTGRSISYDAGPGERGRSYQVWKGCENKARTLDTYWRLSYQNLLIDWAQAVRESTEFQGEKDQEPGQSRLYLCCNVRYSIYSHGFKLRHNRDYGFKRPLTERAVYFHYACLRRVFSFSSLLHEPTLSSFEKHLALSSALLQKSLGFPPQTPRKISLLVI